MKMKLRKIDVLVYLLAGIPALLIILVGLQFLFTQRGYWEVEVGNEGPHLELTLLLVGSDTGSQSQRIVFKGIEASGVPSGTFKLPDEADQMSGIRMTFHDITLRPGMIVLESEGHKIIVLTPHILIDDQVYAWDQPQSIEIVD